MLDLAYQVALIRPGVGVQGNGVCSSLTAIAMERTGITTTRFEKRALACACGIIIWQEQVVQLISDISGMSASDADQLRRAFTCKDNERLIAQCAKRFVEGA